MHSYVFNKSQKFGSSSTSYVKIQLLFPRLGFKLDTFRIRLKRQSCIRRFDIVQSDIVALLSSLNCAIEISKYTSPSSLWTARRSSNDFCLNAISSSSCVINPSTPTSVHCTDLQFLTCCWPRCTPYGRECICRYYQLKPSVMDSSSNWIPNVIKVLTSSTVLHKKLTVVHPVKKFPASQETRMFTAAFTNSRPSY